MIYLILSSGFADDTDEFIKLLKIGFTKDDSADRRFTQYKLHNPTCRTLYTIPEATEQDEKSLHSHFKDLRYSGYGNEWFRYDQSILDYFESHKTKESLQDLLKILAGNNKITPEYYRVIKKIINRWLCLDTRSDVNIKEVIQYLHDNFRLYYTEDLVYDYLKSTYNVSEGIIDGIRKFIDGNLDNSEEVDQFLHEFDSFSNFHDKMRLLCENDLKESEFYIVLDQIPLTYKNYYLKLGPERCKALSYNQTYILREYSDSFFNKEVLISDICSIFKEGSSYPMSDIKIMLGEIYKKLNYNKSPMATDLSEIFELQKTKITTSDGKRKDAFKLLKKNKGDN